MTKNTATILLICAATLFNIITFFAIFTALMVLFFLFSFKLLSDESSAMLVTPLLITIFVTSIVATFLIYRKVLALFLMKIDSSDELFAHIFVPRRKDTGTDAANAPASRN